MTEASTSVGVIHAGYSPGYEIRIPQFGKDLPGMLSNVGAFFGATLCK